MAGKGLMEGLPKKPEDPCPICLLSKQDKIPRGPTIDVSKFAPGFILDMYFAFFNV